LVLCARNSKFDTNQRKIAQAITTSGWILELFVGRNTGGSRHSSPTRTTQATPA